LQCHSGARLTTTRNQQLLTEEIIRDVEEGDRQFNRRQSGKSYCILVGEFFAHAFLARHATHMDAWIVFANEDGTGAKRLNFFGNRNVDAANDRSNQHDSDDANHYAENGEKRTQLISEQRRKRHPQIFVNVTA
jgi:hypothetical protein